MDNNILDLETGNVDYEINYTDQRDIISKSAFLLMLINQHEEEKIKLLFKLGQIFYQNKSSLHPRAICEILNISSGAFSEVYKTAQRHQTYESFKKEYEEWDCHSWNTYQIHLRNLKKKDIDPMPVKNEVKSLIASFNAEYDKKSEDALIEIRGMIDKAVAVREESVDVEYLRFYSCVGCGDSNPPEKGWELFAAKEEKHIIYPLCPECIDKKRNPDPVKIAIMYADYALNLERAYRRVREIL